MTAVTLWNCHSNLLLITWFHHPSTPVSGVGGWRKQGFSSVSVCCFRYRTVDA